MGDLLWPGDDARLSPSANIREKDRRSQTVVSSNLVTEIASVVEKVLSTLSTISSAFARNLTNSDFFFEN
jgi:hypothetical protein